MTTDWEEPTKDERGNYIPEYRQVTRAEERDAVEDLIRHAENTPQPPAPTLEDARLSDLGPPDMSRVRVIATNAEGAELDNLMRDLGWTSWSQGRRANDDATT